MEIYEPRNALGRFVSVKHDGPWISLRFEETVADELDSSQVTLSRRWIGHMSDPFCYEIRRQFDPTSTQRRILKATKYLFVFYVTPLVRHLSDKFRQATLFPYGMT